MILTIADARNFIDSRDHGHSYSMRDIEILNEWFNELEAKNKAFDMLDMNEEYIKRLNELLTK